jgi:hypothetical protein
MVDFVCQELDILFERETHLSFLSSHYRGSSFYIPATWLR